MMKMYHSNDEARLHQEERDAVLSPWEIDCTRLIHCPSFRRLTGKTQLFPNLESDFFRNRLTHSIEVSKISKLLGKKLNQKLDDSHKIDLDILEFAGLAHDLGHPPFGHIGEKALNYCMRDYGGFEGNAQTLRLLTKIEKKFRGSNAGLNITYRSLASILKYATPIPLNQEGVKKIKGYYYSEHTIVDEIVKNIIPEEKREFISFSKENPFKTIECKIMDIADDIAYAIFDLEDALQAGFMSPLDMIFTDQQILKHVSDKITKEIGEKIDAKIELINLFRSIEELIPAEIIKEMGEGKVSVKNIETLYKLSKKLAEDGFYRSKLTSGLIKYFVDGIEVENANKESIPALWNVKLADSHLKQVEVLKQIVYELQIQSPQLKITDFRGREIINKIFETLSGEIEHEKRIDEANKSENVPTLSSITKSKMGFELLPYDFRQLYDSADDSDKKRVICDFIAGMTNRYAIEFYGRITSEEPETIFKGF